MTATSALLAELGTQQAQIALYVIAVAAVGLALIGWSEHGR